MARSEWNKMCCKVAVTIDVMTAVSEATDERDEIDDRVAFSCVAMLLGVTHHEGCPEVYRVFVSNLELTGKWGELEKSALALLKRHAEAKAM